MGRSGRGGGGGGRSFSGGGGSRSFSGGMSSSGRSRSSSSRGRVGGSSGFGGGFRPTRHKTYRSYGGGGYRGGPSGCAGITLGIILVVLVIAAMIVFMAISASNSGITRSTIKREPLPLSMSTEVDYYTDTLGWIKSPSKLENGMRDFYKKTGVQPHLYIVDNIEGSGITTNSEVEPWMSAKYDELFTDEAHLLVLFLDNGHDYGKWLMGGSETKTIIDGEAQEIIYNYIDRYYTSDMDDEEYFSTVFKKSADSIMTVYKSPWPAVILVISLIVFGAETIKIVTNHKRKRAQQKIEEDRLAESILNTPLDKIDGYDAADELADKYK